jgi:hypothetical protein
MWRELIDSRWMRRPRPSGATGVDRREPGARPYYNLAQIRRMQYKEDEGWRCCSMRRISIQDAGGSCQAEVYAVKGDGCRLAACALAKPAGTPMPSTTAAACGRGAIASSDPRRPLPIRDTSLPIRDTSSDPRHPLDPRHLADPRHPLPITTPVPIRDASLPIRDARFRSATVRSGPAPTLRC